MKVKAVPIRSNGGREGIVGRREAGRGRVVKGYSIRIALIPNGLGVRIGYKQIRDRHHARSISTQQQLI